MENTTELRRTVRAAIKAKLALWEALRRVEIYYGDDIDDLDTMINDVATAIDGCAVTKKDVDMVVDMLLEGTDE